MNPLKIRKYPPKSVPEGAVPVCDEILPNGDFLELVRPNASSRPVLLRWNGREEYVGDRHEIDGKTYLPLDLEPTIASALLLPASARAYGATRELFNEISTLVSRATGLSERAVKLVTFFIFGSWFTDRLAVAPLLWITAPPTVSSGPLIQILSLLCRRALLLADPSVAALRSLPLKLTPTVVTEISKITPGFLKALRASNRRGTLAVAGGKLRDVFCAKAVISDQPLRDPAMAGFPLEIVLPASGEFISRLDSHEAEQIVSELQSKLLMYRLENLTGIAKPCFDLREFSAPTQELANTLGSCIVGDSELQAEIVPLLKPRDRAIQVDRTALLESIVIEALWAACHDSKSGELPVTDLTKYVNTILVARGETQQVSPEIVGWKLRGLGLSTDFIAGGRRGLKLPDETRGTIHTLAAAFGVRAVRQEGVSDACSACAAIKNEQDA